MELFLTNQPPDSIGKEINDDTIFFFVGRGLHQEKK